MPMVHAWHHQDYIAAFGAGAQAAVAAAEIYETMARDS
jgi:hypothetical protein